MAQAALAFVPESDVAVPAAGRALPATPFEQVGFEIGRDHARHGLTPPAEQMLSGQPVRQGWDAGTIAFRRRTRRATPPVRQWLAIRLQAWRRGEAFEDLQVTPNLLAQLAVTHCPVTGRRLTEQTGHPTDAVIDRLNPAGAWAAGNLAMMSRHAQAARTGRDWRAAFAQARRAEDTGAELLDGLTALQWQRLAVLESFATPLSHDEAASLPLAVMPPNRARVLNAVQALQVVLTQPFLAADALPLLNPLAALLPPAARQAFHVFMTTLLSRRVAGGHAWDAEAMRQAMQQAWGEALVQRRWQRLALALTAAEAERFVQQASARGLAGAGVRCLDLAQATEDWGLATAPAARAVPAIAAPTAAAAERRGGQPVARPPQGGTRGLLRRVAGLATAPAASAGIDAQGKSA